MKKIIDVFRSWSTEVRGTLMVVVFLSSIASLILHPINFSLVHFQWIIVSVVVFAIIGFLVLRRYANQMRLKEQLAFSLLIIGPFITSILLWTNYLTALVHSSSETHQISQFKKQRHTGGGPEYLPDKYMIYFKDSAMQEYERIRTYSPDALGGVVESVTYHTGTGILGIKVIFKTVFNSPADSTGTVK